MLLKREIGPKIVDDRGGRGSGFVGSWERFLGAASWLPDRHEISMDLASN